MGNGRSAGERSARMRRQEMTEDESAVLGNITGVVGRKDSCENQSELLSGKSPSEGSKIAGCRCTLSRLQSSTFRNVESYVAAHKMFSATDTERKALQSIPLCNRGLIARSSKSFTELIC